jgi:hypothetical protein
MLVLLLGEKIKSFTGNGRVSLVQLVRFLVVELIHSDLNSIFDMSITFMVNYFFSGRRRPHQQRGTLGNRFRES